MQELADSSSTMVDPDSEALEQAWDDVIEGRVVPHERVAVWLQNLADGNRMAPPTP